MAPNFVKNTDTPPGSLNHKWEEMKPKFDKEKVTVIFVLGGPGAGASSSLLPHIVKRRYWTRKGNTMQPPRREVQLLTPLRWRPIAH